MTFYFLFKQLWIVKIVFEIAQNLLLRHTLNLDSWRHLTKKISFLQNYEEYFREKCLEK